MKKIAAAILVFGLMTGLLFLGSLESRGQIQTAGAAQAAADHAGSGEIAEGRDVRAEDVRKIAITFDDEVIIGLSQEICCKEAISMI
ncbi:MAG: hypothetical protein NC420_09980 [Eubacterium sp.]|nr:hypothetical protein [Eubacterium sp.]MCM1217104.1 hypothetical protein [Lachnospiraceae bacterium]MCM1305380.1 hypothetical protein [Butyrivibrio sp.]MCM1345048.1 hypothetical protein [Muribaculaceae bacterium]MCM1240374.1 hypothetical protein [Lachnospiraceae bacterium]